jgi:DNA-binding NarL/FixJ family response regulator
MLYNSKKMSVGYSPAGSGEEGAKIHGMQVLLVDDQAVTTQVYAASVRKTFAGARVHTAVDLPEALQIAAGHALDLVLLDLSLPTCTGIDALYRFRRAFPAVPVLVVSANEDKERIKACLEAGARGYITKTTAVAGLAAAMKTVMDGGRYIPAA